MGAEPKAVYAIRDDDAVISFGATAGQADEPVKARFVPISLLLSSPSAVPVRIRYEIVGGTATARTDYVKTTGVITFKPGEMQKFILLKLLPDLLPESDETIVIRLSSPVNGQLAPETEFTLTVKDRVI